VPDEIEVAAEGSCSRRASNADLPERLLTPGGTPIPLTLVEKVDPSSPSYGDVPGTHAYEMRKVDAVPDLVLKVPEPGRKSPSIEFLPRENSPNLSPVPETRLSRVDSLPRQDLPTSPHAHRRRPSDALPDTTETVQDAPGKPDSSFAGRASGDDWPIEILQHRQLDPHLGARSGERIPDNQPT
jgi:hypothetical protein